MSDVEREPDPEREASPPDEVADEVAEADALVAEAEAVIDADIGAIAAERDEYKSLAQRIQADFENYKKRVLKQQTEHLERAAEDLVLKLLSVLDTADLALAHDDNESLGQVVGALRDVLGKEGLERVDPAGEAFDPTEHDAVMHEPGEGEGESTVSEVLRAGYKWRGRVVRPAMVKVTG
ncbi:MAG: nucleotide exchange factor GrpE [Actinobacteria bacterium]|nr:nucleotide exchange factor GrpE [Actinomycetota bacterium]